MHRRRIAGQPALSVFRPKGRRRRLRQTWPRCSAPPPKARPATRTATSSTWRWSAIRRPACRSARRAQPARRRSPVRPTSTPTCTRAWRRPRASEGFEEIADWFETLAKAERSHANRLQEAARRPSGAHDRRPRGGGVAPRARRAPEPRRRPLPRPRMTVREGSLEAPTRHPLDWRNPHFYDEAALNGGTRAHLRHLPRLPPLRQPVQRLSDPVRSGRCHRERRGRRGGQGPSSAGSSTSATCATSAT